MVDMLCVTSVYVSYIYVKRDRKKRFGNSKEMPGVKIFVRRNSKKQIAYCLYMRNTTERKDFVILKKCQVVKYLSVQIR